MQLAAKIYVFAAELRPAVLQQQHELQGIHHCLQWREGLNRLLSNRNVFLDVELGTLHH